MTTSIDVEIEVGDVNALPVSSTLGDVTVIDGPCVLFGWSVRETSGAAVASVDLYSGSAPIGSIGMLSGGGSSKWFGPLGVRCPGGVKVEANTGAWSGVVYLAYQR